MNPKIRKTFMPLCTLLLLAIGALAQTSEVKEKPPMYSYVGAWSVPRAQWADMEKNYADGLKVLEPALAKGTLMGYGHDAYLVHQVDGFTHDEWWSGPSMASLLNVLDQFYKGGSATSPVLSSATRHEDAIFVSRYYNWHPGTYKDVYSHFSAYKFKKDAPADSLDTLSKNLIVPLLEKMLAAGAIHEYEIDTQAIHSEAPGSFYIVYVAANAEGLDKVNAAIVEMIKSNPLSGPAFGSMTDDDAHRDQLLRTTATFK